MIEVTTYNYIAGETAIIYTIRPFDMTDVVAVGIRIEPAGGTYQNYIIYDESDGWHHGDGSTYLASQFVSMSDINLKRSLHVIIMNLNPNSVYTVSSYKIVNGSQTTITSDTITTKEVNPNKLVLGTITIRDDCYGLYYNGIVIEEGNEAYNQLIEDTRVAFQKCIDMSNAMGNGISYTIEPKVCGNLGAAAANASYEFSLGYHNDESTIIHEMSHNYLNERISNDMNLSFMEFATGLIGAKWKWQGHAHCYPLVSSAHYDTVDNWLIVSVWGFPVEN